MTVNKTILTSATETFGIQGYPREKNRWFVLLKETGTDDDYTWSFVLLLESSLHF